MIDILQFALLAAVVIWILARIFLRAPDHSMFDQPRDPTIGGRQEASPQTAELNARIARMAAQMEEVPRRQRTDVFRRLMNEGLLDAPVDPDELGVRVESVNAGGVPAEWVTAPGADPDRRLLYVPGGGFYFGSPASCRMITAALSHRAGVAVLSVDYRLMPENRRLDSVTDSEAAYRWILDNGPSGPSEAEAVFVAGDSAGGNLALVVTAEARDTGVRQPDGVVAFSPSTDSTIATGSYRSNIKTDPMLGPSVGPFARLPATIKVLLAWMLGRANPSSPRSSPLFASLHGLPPTLVQASDCEMLIDDAQRYVNKARSQGSPAELQVWPGTVHVFQMFGHIIPEAGEAFDKAAEFLANPRSISVPASQRDTLDDNPARSAESAPGQHE